MSLHERKEGRADEIVAEKEADEGIKSQTLLQVTLFIAVVALKCNTVYFIEIRTKKEEIYCVYLHIHAVYL